VAINVGRFDATKHLAHAVVGDASSTLEALLGDLDGWRAAQSWVERGRRLAAEWNVYVDQVRSPEFETPSGLPSYAQVIGAVNARMTAVDYVVAAAGGLPGELNKTWRSLGAGTLDCEYGFSCMGYEIGGGWGAAMQRGGAGQVVSFCGDGSYMMMSPDVFSSVLSGHKMIVILCDNGGFSVIQRLQEFKGAAAFNNRYEQGTRRALAIEPDYAAHAASMGALVEEVASLDELGEAFARARSAERTTVIVIRTDPTTWTEGDAWWDVGVPETSHRTEVTVAKAAHEAERKHQRLGV
jgi:3D-(3,5/4)-trihydroxycyclohexane-1,2-dione acylhydrolase (decyclizing)